MNDSNGGEKMVKIVIPTSDEKGERLSDHFGRAPYFAWFSIEDGSVVEKGIVPNDSEHFGGVGRPPERIAHLEPDAVVTTGMGMRAINMFQQMNVARGGPPSEKPAIRGEHRPVREGGARRADRGLPPRPPSMKPQGLN
jgi:predicted Fe-Mo cluster-binding NifX family protein